jgi:hypothetical protein
MGKVIDLYEVEHGEDPYDPDEFYVSSTDRQGHHATQYISLKPETSGEIASMVASKDFPEYKTAGHFIRDAIVHRLHYLEDLRPNADRARYIRLLMHAANQEREDTVQREQVQLCEKWETTMQNLSLANDWPGLRRAVKACRAAAEDLQEPYDRRLYALVTRYDPDAGS